MRRHFIPRFPQIAGLLQSGGDLVGKLIF